MTRRHRSEPRTDIMCASADRKFRTANKAPEEASHDARLDAALEMTFPASDPISPFRAA